MFRTFQHPSSVLQNTARLLLYIYKDIITKECWLQSKWRLIAEDAKKKIQINGDNELNLATKVLSLNAWVARFSEGRSHSICKASFILSWKTVGAESKLEKQASNSYIYSYNRAMFCRTDDGCWNIRNMSSKLKCVVVFLNCVIS